MWDHKQLAGEECGWHHRVREGCGGESQMAEVLPPSPASSMPCKYLKEPDCLGSAAEGSAGSWSIRYTSEPRSTQSRLRMRPLAGSALQERDVGETGLQDQASLCSAGVGQGFLDQNCH